MSSISQTGNMADTSKDGLLLGGAIRYVTATSQLMCQSKQVPVCVYVILFKRFYFRQYFVYLRERIFNWCNVKLKLKFAVISEIIGRSGRRFPRASYCERTSRQYGAYAKTKDYV